jgi:glycosyltransferase involved in cell wall biosynthesis
MEEARHKAAIGQFPRVSVIMPARNEGKNLARVLDALHEAKRVYPAEVELILVDNGSTDDTAAIAASRGCRVVVEPRGPISRIRNFGASLAQGEVLAFLDSDCVVHPAWLTLCVEALVAKEIGGVGTRAIPELAKATWVQLGWYLLVSGACRPEHPQWLGTSNLLVRKETFQEVGGFNENLETAEDVDFCQKVRARHKLRLVERCPTIHLGESATILRLFKKELWRGKHSLRHMILSRRKREDLRSVALPLGYVLLVALFAGCSGIYPPFIILAVFTFLAAPAALMLKKRPRCEGARSLAAVYAVATVFIVARGVASILEIMEFSGVFLKVLQGRERGVAR